METLQQKIEQNNASPNEIREVIARLDKGELRVVEPSENGYKVNDWIQNAIKQYFGICTLVETRVGDIIFRDKIPLKTEFGNIRIVPGGNAIRYGSFLGNNVIMMPPSYVNIGAYIGQGTMIDSNVLVGSCAQIGENVHLSAGVQIGGVLEPAGARPVIVEDGAFVGAGTIVVEGVLIRKNAVIAPGVVLSASTRILETDKDGKIIREYRGEIPAGAIVLPGARQRGEIMLQTPVIIGYKNKLTSEKLALTDFLRSF